MGQVMNTLRLALVGAGKGDGAMDAANILKPALARGELRAIGATTLDEFQKYFEQDKALERRFQNGMVDEPSTVDAISILRGLKERYENHHKVRIKDEAIVASVELSNRYITSRFLPDKALALIDEAAAKLRLEMNSVPEEIDELDRKVRQLEIEREAIRREKDQGRIEELTREIDELNAKRTTLRAKWQGERDVLEKIQKNKQALDDLKVQAAEAERNGDYGRVAEIRYGKMRETENEIAGLQAEVSKNAEAGAMIKEEVDAEDIAEGVAVVSAQGARYFTDSRYIEAAENNLPGFTVRMTHPGSSDIERINEVIGEHTIKKLGFEESNMTYAMFLEFQHALHAVLVPMQKKIDAFRASKEPWELELMRKAQEITALTFAQLQKVLCAGMTEKDLRAELIYRLYKNCANGLSFDPIVVSGPNTSMPHGVPSDRELQFGDFITMDFGCLY